MQQKEDLLRKLDLPIASDLPSLKGEDKIRAVLQEPIPSFDDNEIMKFIEESQTQIEIPTSTCTPTTTVLQLHHSGTLTPMRTYIDPGSAANFVNAKLVEEFNIKVYPANSKFRGAIREVKGMVVLNIRPPRAKTDTIVFAYVPEVWDSAFGDFLLGIPGARDMDLVLDYSSSDKTKKGTTILFKNQGIRQRIEGNKVRSMRWHRKEMIAAIGREPLGSKDNKTVYSTEDDWVQKLSHVPEGELKKKYLDLMVKHKRQFWKGGFLPAMKRAVYSIDYRGPPFREATIPLPYKQRLEINRQCDMEASQGRLVEITENTHLLDYVSNAFLKREADKDRMCINYVTLNAQTVKTNMPIPSKERLISTTSGGDYYHITDSKSAYNQMMVHKDSQKYLVFVIPGMDGQNRYFAPTRANFGTSNMPGEYSRVSGDLFTGRNTSVYLDDITVKGKNGNHDEAYSAWERVLESAAKHNVLFSLKKTHLFQHEVKFLGEILNKDGHRPNAERVRTLQTWPEPRTKKQLQSFLGLYNFLAPSKRSATSSSLQALQKYTHNDVPAVLPRGKITELFKQIKTELCTWLLLVPFEPNRKSFVMTDSSDVGLGGVIFQQTPDGLLAVAVCAKAWPKRKNEYSSHQKEGMALLYTLKRFETMLRLSEVVLLTDSANTVDLLSGGKPKSTPAIWLRWRRYISQTFEAEIIHVPGKLNLASDILSRQMHTIAPITSITDSPLLLEVRQQQKDDPWIQSLLVQAQKRTTTEKHLKPYFTIMDDLLYRCHPQLGNQLVIPKAMKDKLLHLEHDPELKGHPGASIMTKTIERTYYWPGMYQDIKTFVGSCLACQLAKAKLSKKYATNATRQCSHIFQVFSMDLIDMNSVSVQFHYVLCVMDYYSGFVVLIPLRNKTAPSILKGLWDVFTIFGPPQHLLSDRGSEFLNRLVERFTEKSGIQHVVTYAYHAQGNSKNERSHASIVQCLRIYAAEHRARWVEHIKGIQYMLNCRISASSGLSAYEILFGVPPRPLHHMTPFQEYDHDQMEACRSRITNMLLEQQNVASNKAEPARPQKFQVGQHVLVVREYPRRPKHLFPALGPFIITELLSTTGYRLQHCEDSTYVLDAPSKWLRPFHTRERKGGGMDEGGKLGAGNELDARHKLSQKQLQKQSQKKDNKEKVNGLSDESSKLTMGGLRKGTSFMGGLRKGKALNERVLPGKKPEEAQEGEMVLIQQGRMLRLAEVISVQGNEVIVHWFGTRTNKTLSRDRWEYFPGWMDNLTGKVTYTRRENGSTVNSKTYLGGPSTTQLDKKEIVDKFPRLTEERTIPTEVVDRHRTKRLF